ncbi:XAC2610-related protein [Mucilaginibacter aquariorum]|uniref:XAC2610-related protein n=1 Tax=Mucilaginibacter aquariorum TaxID=2967225 RepID=UPI002115661C|nr:hypothetical protein [Mucilaginibacter aquariorum]
MPKAFFLVFMMLIISCKQKETGNQRVVKTKTVKHKALISKVMPVPKVVDTILDITRDVVDGQHFTIQRTMQVGLYVFNSKNDTIFRDSSYISNAKFKDFNNDGYKDIWIVHSENVPGIRGLLLYNKASKTYQEVIGFEAFPAPEAIANTKYYYSYHRSGCADMNWTSDLFYIDNYKPVKIGTIEGYECADTDIKDGVYIYKKRGKKETEIRRLSINIINNYEENKWGFIQSYWHKNYKLFL